MTEKPHKFFERYLDNDLEELSDELIKRYDIIKDGNKVNTKDIWLSSNSISTIKWRDYNVFQFYITGIRNLYTEISTLAKEACEYYEIDFAKQNYFIQGWFNINSANKGKLTWHDHGPSNENLFHGYYCVTAEPSITKYSVNGTHVDNVNKNNRLIMSEMGHPHSMDDWEWEGKRITVAYDILPLKNLQRDLMSQEQHWIPLC
jgi:hypothetical protein